MKTIFLNKKRRLSWWVGSTRFHADSHREMGLMDTRGGVRLWWAYRLWQDMPLDNWGWPPELDISKKITLSTSLFFFFWKSVWEMKKEKKRWHDRGFFNEKKKAGIDISEREKERESEKEIKNPFYWIENIFFGVSFKFWFVNKKKDFRFVWKKWSIRGRYYIQYFYYFGITGDPQTFDSDDTKSEPSVKRESSTTPFSSYNVGWKKKRHCILRVTIHF